MFILTLKILGIIATTVSASTLYRMGGADGYNTKFRDLGVPTCMVLSMIIMGKIHWILAICFMLLFGSLTTYHKWFGRLLGRKDNEVHWEGWAMTGFCYAMAMLPFAWTYGHWLGFISRTIVCVLFISGWSVAVGNAKWEELGRGFIINATLPLLLIG